MFTWITTIWGIFSGNRS